MNINFGKSFILIFNTSPMPISNTPLPLNCGRGVFLWCYGYIKALLFSHSSATSATSREAVSILKGITCP